MEKLKEHPAENWDEDILLDILKGYDSKSMNWRLIKPEPCSMPT